MSDRYRGRTTRQRNVAEKVARDWAERRAASELTEKELDLEKASVDAEVELLDPAARRAQEAAAPMTQPSRPRRPAARPVGGPCRVIVPWRRPPRARTSRSCRASCTTPARSGASAIGWAMPGRRPACTASTSG